jgi:hypothetical protein
LNKKLKKGLTTTMAAAMGLGVVIPAVPVIAAPATSGWVLTAQGWTYYKSGVKATGWVLDGGKWYLLDSNGVMKTGWAKDAGTWYFLTASGAMATGWVKDTDGKWYFLKTSGAMAASTWAGNYYLTASGAMAVSTVTEDGWTVDANGAWDGHSKAADLAAATAAVVAAEASKSQADIDAATALVAKLTIAADATALTGRLNAIATNLEVSSVTPINATQVKVVFTNKVDETDAQLVARYSIDGTNPTAASLDTTDGKTVTLTFASAEVTDAVLVVNPVLSATDETVSSPKYTKVLTYTDEVKPDIASVTAKTNGTVATSVTVTATEPILSTLAKIDGSYVTVNFGGTDTATINGLSLDNTKTHTIELVNLTDKATTPNTTVSTSKSFSVVTDTVAPTATLSAKSDKTILVTFSKSMNAASVQAALAAGTTAVKDEAFSGVNTLVATPVADTNNTQFTIAITDTLYTNTNSRRFTVILPNTITDSLGNAIATSTQQVVLTKDVTAPAATGYKIVKNANGEVAGLEVNFSEGLTANAAVAQPVIVNSNGQIVTGTLLGGISIGTAASGATKVVYTFTTPAKLTGAYNFSFGSSLVTDQAETANGSVAFNYNVDFGTAAGTFDLTLANAALDVVTVNFGRPVKGGAVANSATDLNNYSLAGKPLPAGTTIYLSADQTTATITLPTNGVDTTDPAAYFTVANVKSLTGETLNSYAGTVAVLDNTQPVLTSAVLNSNGSITLGFSETLTTPTVVGDYTVKVNNKTVASSAIAALTTGVGSEAGKYVIPNFVTTYLDQDGTPSNGDEIVYIDADGVAGYDASKDILLQTGTFASVANTNYASGVVGGKDAGISTITITTKAGANGADADPDGIGAAIANVIKAGTTITVK